MARKREIYWLLDDVTKQHRARALILKHQNIEVSFFTNVKALLDRCAHKRVSTIVVSDQGPEYLVTENLHSICNLPDMKAVRFILSIENHRDRILELAASYCFRDMIPLDLPEDRWVYRLKFSTANGPIRYTQPSGQVTMNNVSQIFVPGRAIWMNNESMLIESKVVPPMGSLVKLGGPIADYLGVPSITVQIEETRRKNLVYRFSDALLVSFKLPAPLQDKVYELLSELKKVDLGPKVKVFVIAKSQELRESIGRELKHSTITLNFALQLQAIAHEPKYFSPSVVIIESTLLENKPNEHFDKMLFNLDHGTTVYLVGDKINIKHLREKFSNLRFLQRNVLPANFAKSLLTASNKKQVVDDSGVYLNASDEKSEVDVILPARLTRIHPRAVAIHSPYQIGKFALIRLKSPLIHKMIQQDVWGKTTNSYRLTGDIDDRFVYGTEAYLVDLTATAQVDLAISISGIITRHFERFVMNESSEEHRESASKTPQLGVIHTAQKQLGKMQVKEQQKFEAPTKPVPKPPVMDRAKADDTEDDEKDLLSKIVDVVAPGETAAPESYKPKRRKKKKKNYKNDIYMGLFAVAFIGFVIAAVMAMTSALSENYKKSGEKYKNSLLRFAPKHWEENKDDTK